MLKLFFSDENAFILNLNQDNFIKFNEEIAIVVSNLEENLVENIIFISNVIGKIDELITDIYMKRFIHINILECFKDKKNFFNKLWDNLLKLNFKSCQQFNNIHVIFQAYTYNSEDLLLDCFYEFIKIVKEFLNGKIGNNELITSITLMLDFYYQIKNIYDLYFQDLIFIHKESIFIDSLIIENLKNIDLSSNKLSEVILANNKITNNLKVIMMFKLLSKDNLEYFIKIFLQAIKNIIKIGDNIAIFTMVTEIIKYYISSLPKNLADFLKIEIKNIFNASLRNNYSYNIVNIINYLIYDNSLLLEELYYYLDIDNFTKFEEYYIFSLINRSFDERFNIEEERTIINKILYTSREQHSHSYKLQTTVNSIKTDYNIFIKISGIPAHCYTLFNFDCKPKLEESLNDLFEKSKKTLPTNAKIVFNQGYIEFEYRKNIYRANVLQYSILLLIKRKIIFSDKIIEKLELSVTLFDYLVENLKKENLLIEKKLNEKIYYTLNTNLAYKTEIINISVDFSAYYEVKQNEIKYLEKTQHNIIDCYIIKYLKIVKKANITQIFTEISNRINNFNETIVTDRLKHLTSKEYIKHSIDDCYNYI